MDDFCVLSASRHLYVGGTVYGGKLRVWRIDVDDPAAGWEFVDTPTSLTGTNRVAYDSVRDRIVIAGTWALPLSNPTDWTQIGGVLASMHADAGAAYNPSTDRIVSFGGNWGCICPDPPGAVSDTHVFDSATSTWSKVTPLGTPPARFGQSMTFDPSRNWVLMFGGHGTSTDLNDAWRYSNANSWGALPGPGALVPPGAYPIGYDPVGDRMIVYGGSASEVWAMTVSPTVWTTLAPATSLTESQTARAMAYDPVGHRMLIHGAAGPEGALRELRLTDPVELNEIAPWGLVPPERSYFSYTHAGVIDVPGDRLVVVLGNGEVWTRPLAHDGSWERLEPTGTPPFAGDFYRSQAVFDPVRRRMLFYGGRSGGADLAVTFALELDGPPQWTTIATAGTSPGARAGHAAVYDPIGDRMILYGGTSSGAGATAPWALSLSGTPTWTMLSPTGTPPPAGIMARGIYDAPGNRMWVFHQNDLYTLSLGGSPEWQTHHPITSSPWLDAAIALDEARNRVIMIADVSSSTTRLLEMPLDPDATATVMTPTGSGPGRLMDTSLLLYNPRRDQLVVDGPIDETWTIEFGSPLAVDPPIARPVANLDAPWPNPASDRLDVAFTLAQPGRVRVDVVDVSGRRVASLLDGVRAAGHHVLRWSAAGHGRIADGLYFIRLRTDGGTFSRRVAFMR